MADKKLVKKLDKDALEIRLKLLKLCEQTLIHVGGDLSVADLMTVIWQYAIRYDIKNPHWEERDRFILSKGHASAVTSFCQAMKGCYTYDEIYREYCTDNGLSLIHIFPYKRVYFARLHTERSVFQGVYAAKRLCDPFHLDLINALQDFALLCLFFAGGPKGPPAVLLLRIRNPDRRTGRHFPG